MTSGSRRLNYTRRKRIAREHVRITIHIGSDRDMPTFEAAVQLDQYNLPQDARVYVEAYRQSAFQRFEFGTIGISRPGSDCQLTQFGAAEGTLFRIKVVEPASDGELAGTSVFPPRILAHADRIRPDHAGKRKSLLPLESWDSRDQPWLLEIDDDTGPLLRISSQLVSDRYAFVRSNEFRSLVLPELLRRILTRAVEHGSPMEDDTDWRAKWVIMAAVRLGVGPPGENPQDGGDGTEEWIESAVDRFCHRNSIANHFCKWWQPGGST